MAKDRQSSEIFEAHQDKFNFKKVPGALVDNISFLPKIRSG